MSAVFVKVRVFPFRWVVVVMAVDAYGNLKYRVGWLWGTEARATVRAAALTKEVYR